MGHQITIDGDEACTLATELAARTGENVHAVVTLAPGDDFRASFGDDSSSDHGWLHDEQTPSPEAPARRCSSKGMISSTPALN